MRLVFEDAASVQGWFLLYIYFFFQNAASIRRVASIYKSDFYYKGTTLFTSRITYKKLKKTLLTIMKNFG